MLTVIKLANQNKFSKCIKDSQIRKKVANNLLKQIKQLNANDENETLLVFGLKVVPRRLWSLETAKRGTE